MTLCWKKNPNLNIDLIPFFYNYLFCIFFLYPFISSLFWTTWWVGQLVDLIKQEGGMCICMKIIVFSPPRDLTLHCLSLLCLETLTSHAAQQPNIPLMVSKSLATDLLIVVWLHNLTFYLKLSLHVLFSSPGFLSKNLVLLLVAYLKRGISWRYSREIVWNP